MKITHESASGIPRPTTSPTPSGTAGTVQPVTASRKTPQGEHGGSANPGTVGVNHSTPGTGQGSVGTPGPGATPVPVSPCWWLQPGDVIRNSGRLWVVDYVNDCRARAVALERDTRTFESLNGHAERVQVSIPEKATPINVAPVVDSSCVIERRGVKWLKDFLAARSNRSGTKSQGSNERTDSVKNKDKKEEKKPSAGKLGGLFGFSVCAVLRRLGKEGVTTAHAAAIMEKQKVECQPTTMQLALSAGRRGQGNIADMTKAQVEELVKCAPAPAPAPKPEKPAKAKKAGGKGGGKKGAAERAKDAKDTPKEERVEMSAAEKRAVAYTGPVTA